MLRSFLFLLLCSVLGADHLLLEDGRRLEGVVSVSGDSLVLRRRGFRQSFHRDAVRAVSYGPTAEERLTARLAAVDLGDPERLYALAAWAEHQGLEDRAEELLLWARATELEQRIARSRSVEERFAVARWVREQGYSPATVELCDARVFARDPDHFGLRALRGDVFCAGRWMSRAEAETHTARELEVLRAGLRPGADAEELLIWLDEISGRPRYDRGLLRAVREALPPPATLRVGPPELSPGHGLLRRVLERRP